MNIELNGMHEEQTVFIALRCFVDELYKDNTDPDDFIIVEPFIRAGEKLIAQHFPDEDNRRYIYDEETGTFHEQRGD